MNPLTRFVQQSPFAFASLAVQSNLKVTGMGNLGQNLQNLSVVCY